MIGFLKRWFVTKNEIESVYSQLDTIAHAIQDIRKDQWIRREAERGAIVKQPSEVVMSFERVDNLKPRKLRAKPVVVDSLEEPKRKPPPFPWLENVPSLEHTIRDKMSQLAGSSENFIRSCRKKDCHVLVSKTRRVMLDQSGKTDKLREYPYGYIEMRHKRKRTSAGNPMRKYYTFETPKGYENAKKALEQMKCPYTTGKAQ